MKTILSRKMKCVTVNKSVNRSQVNFMKDVINGERGPQAKQMVSFNFSDPKDVDAFEPDKEYTISITE
jgi:hypothetical protein